MVISVGRHSTTEGERIQKPRDGRKECMKERTDGTTEGVRSDPIVKEMEENEEDDEGEEKDEGWTVDVVGRSV